MKMFKVKDIYDACKEEIKKGHGDYVVMLSNDEEGNGFHYCFYTFTEAKNVVDKYNIFDIDEEVASIDKTLVLG